MSFTEFGEFPHGPDIYGKRFIISKIGGGEGGEEELSPLFGCSQCYEAPPLNPSIDTILNTALKNNNDTKNK